MTQSPLPYTPEAGTRPDPRFHPVGVITNGVGHSSTYHLNLTRSMPNVRLVRPERLETAGRVPFAGREQK